MKTLSPRPRAFQIFFSRRQRREKRVAIQALTSPPKWGCRGRSPLPEREVSSLTLSSPSGPQARQKHSEGLSDSGTLDKRNSNMLYL